MKQNVLEQTDYLVPSCKAIDMSLEGALCGSYGKEGQAGTSILDDVYGNGEDF